MKYHRIAIWLAPIAVALGGCAHPVDRPIIQDRVSEVRVPVSAPCVQGERPAQPTALRDRIPSAEWEAMTTDQRENHLAAQALDRKAYGDRITAATAGCR